MIKKALVLIFSIMISGCSSIYNMEQNIQEGSGQTWCTCLSDEPSFKELTDEEMRYTEIVPKEIAFSFYSKDLKPKKIYLDENTKLKVECVDKHKMQTLSGRYDENNGEYVDIEIYRNKVMLPEYGIGLQYLSPNPCEIDEKGGKWFVKGTFTPHGWSTKDFPNYSEIMTFKPCEFTPISIYKFTGHLTDAVTYFSHLEGAPYEEVRSQNIKLVESERLNRYKSPSRLGHLGLSTLSGIQNKSINAFRWHGGGSSTIDHDTFATERWIINKTGTNILATFKVYGVDCGGYVQNNLLEIDNS